MTLSTLLYAASSNPDYLAHPDTMSVLIGVLFTIVAGYTVYTLKQINKNQEELFKRMNDLSKEFYMVKGEHDALKKQHNHKTEIDEV